jgi:hypothetical protein
LNLDLLRGMVAEIKPNLIVHTNCGDGAFTKSLAAQCLKNMRGFIHSCDPDEDNTFAACQIIQEALGRFPWKATCGLGPALVSEVEGADFYILSGGKFSEQLKAMKPADHFHLVTDKVEHFDEILKLRFWYGMVKLGGMAIFQR